MYKLYKTDMDIFNYTYIYDKVINQLYRFINKITAWDGIALGHLSSRDIPQLIEQVIVTVNF